MLRGTITKKMLFVFMLLTLFFIETAVATDHWKIEKNATFRITGQNPGEGTAEGHVRSHAYCGCGVDDDRDPKKKNKKVTWNVATGGSGNIANCSSGVAHANSSADLSFSAGVMHTILGKPFKYVDTSISLDLKSNAVPCTKPGSSSYASASGTGKIIIPSGKYFKYTSSFTDFDRAKVSVKNKTAKTSKNSLGLHSYDNTKKKDKTRFHDPFILGYIEEETNEWHEETLMAINYELSGNTEASFDFSGDVASEGISLLAFGDHKPSSILMELSCPSSWVREAPVDSSISLIDGVFSATGIFESLHWNLTYGTDGFVLGATLAPEFIPDISVEAQTDTSSFVEGNHYKFFYVEDAEWAMVESSAIPEPATISLLAVGMMMLFYRRIA